MRIPELLAPVAAPQAAEEIANTKDNPMLSIRLYCICLLLNYINDFSTV